MRAPRIENDYGEVYGEVGGFTKIAELYSQHAVETGFILNLLVVGRRGSGAGTLVNSLFSAPIAQKSRSDKFTTTVNEIVEDGVVLRISVTTYHESDYDAVVRFIRQKHEEYYEHEQGLSMKVEDRRIHACLFILPLDHLKQTEVCAMRSIGQVCNLLPVIVKADMYTIEELRARREHLHRIFVESGVEVFGSSEIIGCLGGPATAPSGEVVRQGSTQNMVHDSNVGVVPGDILATVASEKAYELQGRIVRGRRYPWGFVEITNEMQSDFRKLQRLLITTGYEELLQRTDSVFYKKYRRERPKEDAAAHESVMKKRLHNLQTQLEEVVTRKHKAILSDLRREEQNIGSVPAGEEEASSASGASGSAG